MDEVGKMMKHRFRKTVVLFLCLMMQFSFMTCFPFQAFGASGTFVNPGFEEPVVNGKIPGWRQAYGSGGISVSDEVAYDGTYSIKMVDTSASQNYGLLSDRVQIEGGLMYKITAKLYQVNGTKGMYLYFYNSAGKQIKAYSKGFNVPLEQWSTVTIEGAAPADAVAMEVLLYSGGPNVGTGYFDHLTYTSERELNVTFGNPVNHGSIVQVAQSPRAVVGSDSNGNEIITYVVNGAPAVFYAVDPLTGNVVFTQKLPGIDTVWAIVPGSDGNIYFSGTSNGILYRYLPDAKKIESLGKNPCENFVWALKASRDGKIYGGTYPSAKVFEYDIATGTFRDFGTVKPGENYVRGVGVSDDYIYAGIGADYYLIQINRKTGEMRDINFPGRGEPGFINNIEFYEGHAIIRYAREKFFVLDEQSGQTIDTVTGIFGDFSPPSPYNPDLTYYRKDNDLYTYNWKTRESTKIEGILALNSYFGNNLLDWITLKNGDKAGKKVLIGNYLDGEYFLYDPEDNDFQTYHPQIDGAPVNLISLKTGPDGKLYAGAIYRAMSIYNPETRQIEQQEVGMPQVEGMGILNGNMYFGTYSGAEIYRYNPTQPFHFSQDASGNPGKVYDIEESQDRPHAFASGDGKLFIGTIPNYGALGGALTVYVEQSGSWKVYRNVVQDQTIVGMAYRDGKLYGSTNIWGGLGIEPKATEAKIFVWDVAKGQKITEFTPEIPGLDQKPQSIGRLTFGPDGLLWGATGGTIFALNPDTYEVVKSKVIYDYPATAYPIYLEWGDDGLLYTTVGRNLTVIAPNTLDYKMLKENVHVIALARDGSIFYLTGSAQSQLFQLPVPLKEVSLTAPGAAMRQGMTASVTVTGILANGKTSSMPGASFEYFSSNPDAISIKDGVMTAQHAGAAEIWSRVSWNGTTMESNKITISVMAVPITSISVASSNGGDTINQKGGTLQMFVNVLPEDATDRSVIWSVYEKDGTTATRKAEIDSSGLLTAIEDGVVKVTATAADGSGVKGEALITIDTTAPQTSAVISPTAPDGQNGWYMHPVTVTLNATDNISGVAKTEYSLDGGMTWQLYKSQVTINQDGKYTMSSRSTDNAGNVDAVKTISFNLDAVAPTITVTGIVYNSMLSDAGDILPMIMLNDDLSGVESSKTTVTLDTAAYQTGASTPLYTLPLGAHTLLVTSSDLAGNMTRATVTFQTYANLDSLKALETRFAGNQWIDNAGIANNLRKKLDKGDLREFIHEVEAQNGKHITKDAAGYSLRDAHAIMDSLKAMVNQFSSNKSITRADVVKELLDALNKGDLKDFAQKVQEESGKHISPDAAKSLLQGLESLVQDKKDNDKKD
jgi:hypothetical protein